MNREEIAAGIEALKPWFHRIELPEGLVTKAQGNFGEDDDHPLPTWQKVKQVLPAALNGKSVLDVGCNAGFYSIEARKRGAERVLGVDATSWHIRQARFVTGALGLGQTRFLRKSVYELDAQELGKFDVVLALGLIYHLKHLYAGMEALYHITGDLLILETAIAPDTFRLPSNLPLYGADERRVHSVALVENEPNVTEPDRNWFLPTAEATAAMLRTVGFIDVKITDESPTRAVLTARKNPDAIDDSRRATWLRADLQVEGLPETARPGQNMSLMVVAHNIGPSTWRTAQEQPEAGHVCLGGQLMAKDNPLWARPVDWRGLSEPVASGEEVRFELSLVAPDEPGTYELELDLVSINVTWFQESGSQPYFGTFTVVP
ncbi:MAG: tRNA (mo5U34)-methyltransferase [Puniceicoccaceae bacterium 5H]|nr:MAG: tRNA (mo5U34)-methyltransferase [Puniceicoccaceae bacterium 5H]